MRTTATAATAAFIVVIMVMIMPAVMAVIMIMVMVIMLLLTIGETISQKTLIMNKIYYTEEYHILKIIIFLMKHRM